MRLSRWPVQDRGDAWNEHVIAIGKVVVPVEQDTGDLITVGYRAFPVSHDWANYRPTSSPSESTSTAQPTANRQPVARFRWSVAGPSWGGLEAAEQSVLLVVDTGGKVKSI